MSAEQASLTVTLTKAGQSEEAEEERWFLTQVVEPVSLPHRKYKAYELTKQPPTQPLGEPPRLFLHSLTVALEWVPDERYCHQLERAFRQASELLYDVSDGTMFFHEVTFVGPAGMGTADIQILASNRIHPRSWVGGLFSQGHHPIRLGRGLWHHRLKLSIPWEESEGYHTLIHEWLHYAWGLVDEYLSDDAEKPHLFGQKEHALIVPLAEPSSYSMMAVAGLWSEVGPLKEQVAATLEQHYQGFALASQRVMTAAELPGLHLPASVLKFNRLVGKHDPVTSGGEDGVYESGGYPKFTYRNRFIPLSHPQLMHYLPSIPPIPESSTPPPGPRPPHILLCGPTLSPSDPVRLSPDACWLYLLRNFPSLPEALSHGEPTVRLLALGSLELLIQGETDSHACALPPGLQLGSVSHAQNRFRLPGAEKGDLVLMLAQHVGGISLFVGDVKGEDPLMVSWDARTTENSPAVPLLYVEPVTKGNQSGQPATLNLHIWLNDPTSAEPELWLFPFGDASNSPPQRIEPSKRDDLSEPGYRCYKAREMPSLEGYILALWRDEARLPTHYLINSFSQRGVGPVHDGVSFTDGAPGGPGAAPEPAGSADGNVSIFLGKPHAENVGEALPPPAASSLAIVTTRLFPSQVSGVPLARLGSDVYCVSSNQALDQPEPLPATLVLHYERPIEGPGATFHEQPALTRLDPQAATGFPIPQGFTPINRSFVAIPLIREASFDDTMPPLPIAERLYLADGLVPKGGRAEFYCLSWQPVCPTVAP